MIGGREGENPLPYDLHKCHELKKFLTNLKIRHLFGKCVEMELPSVSCLNNLEIILVKYLFTEHIMLPRPRCELAILCWIYEDHLISFQNIFVWALLLRVHTWNSSILRSNLFRLQCTCCAVPTTSRRPYRSPLVWARQWLSSQPLLFPQLSHNDSLWA